MEKKLELRLIFVQKGDWILRSLFGSSRESLSGKYIFVKKNEDIESGKKIRFFGSFSLVEMKMNIQNGNAEIYSFIEADDKGKELVNAMLMKNNLRVGGRFGYEYIDIKKITFRYKGDTYTMDEFQNLKLPEDEDCEMLYDNGYSYIGTRLIDKSKFIRNIDSHFINGLDLNSDGYRVDRNTGNILVFTAKKEWSEISDS